jgi:uncharacterized protein YfdQ (DUF2303 family)
VDVNLNKETLDAAVELGKQLSLVNFEEPMTKEKIHYLVLPKPGGNWEIVSLQNYQFPDGIPADRIKAAPKLQDGTSFCAYVKKFHDDALQLFADSTTGKFVGLLDYHVAGDPGWCQHRPEFTMRTSPQWDIWFGQNDKLIPQGQFAEFLEENYRDIESPSHAHMLEVATQLGATTDVTFESKVNLINGSGHLRWSEDTKTTGVTEVPTRFKISIPVYYGEPPVSIDCLLRFRINQGKLSFQYKMYRPAELKLQAFEHAAQVIGEQLESEVHLGIPG